MHFASSRALLTAAFALVPTLAFAHTGVSEAHDAMHGFMHPIGGLDHVLAMIVGGALGMTGIHLPLVETLIAVSVVALGAVICLNVAPPVAGAVALVAVAAIFHGF